MRAMARRTDPDAGGGPARPDADALLPRASVLPVPAVLLGVALVVLVAAVSLLVGPAPLAAGDVARELLDRLIPGLGGRLGAGIGSGEGLDATGRAILWELRAPRVVLGLLVGSMLAGAGAAYQGVFRNPLADPYLLGIAAGAGLGATLAIAVGFARIGGGRITVPIAAFLGAAAAVALTIGLSVRRGRAAPPATLVLAGVAVAAFLSAAQTAVLQRNADSLRQVYAWLLGRLSTSAWDDVLLVLPYAAVGMLVLVLTAGALDVLAVGDEEAVALGLRPDRVRLLVLAAASLLTAVAVSVSGLIGFVGLVVPHGVRLLVGTSNRRVVPLSLLFGGAFLALADLGARTLTAPAELPLGVVTALVGAPAFLVVLRSQVDA